MATIKFIKKEQKKKLLLDAGYKVFNMHGHPADELFAIIVIACNKLNPDNPGRAFKTVAELERKLSLGHKVNKKNWKYLRETINNEWNN